MLNRTMLDGSSPVGIANHPMTKFKDSPFVKFMTDTGSDYGNQYYDLASKYSKMSEGGMLGPEDFAKLLSSYDQSMQPRIDKQRSQVSAGVNRRMGSRSGASAKATYNLVDVPANQARSDYRGQLEQWNLESRKLGMQNELQLYNMLFGGQENYANLLMGKEANSNSFGFGDLLGLVASALPLIPSGKD